MKRKEQGMTRYFLNLPAVRYRYLAWKVPTLPVLGTNFQKYRRYGTGTRYRYFLFSEDYIFPFFVHYWLKLYRHAHHA